MGIVDTIQRCLDEYPRLSYHVDGNSLVVEPCSEKGFSVWLRGNGGETIVGFDGWHEHFESGGEAISCFLLGLSNRCRLKVHSRGAFAYRWELERRLDDQWEVDSRTGLMLFPFWRRHRVEYLQNDGMTLGMWYEGQS